MENSEKNFIELIMIYSSRIKLNCVIENKWITLYKLLVRGTLSEEIMLKQFKWQKTIILEKTENCKKNLESQFLVETAYITEEKEVWCDRILLDKEVMSRYNWK